MAAPHVIFQPSLLDAGAVARPDASFERLERVQLDLTSWVDHTPAWVTQSDTLFDQLLHGVDWGQRRRHMYDRRVAEPRLTSWWSTSLGRPLDPPVLEDMRRLLSERYERAFDSMGVNLYRDGRDSVAWHGDKIPAHIDEPLVAIVSVGEPRTFLLRPRGGGASRAFRLGRGDLLVTGGQCQRAWDHSVPKVARAGPRISITFRHGLGGLSRGNR